MMDLVTRLDYQLFLPLISRFPIPLAYRLAEWRGSWIYRTRKESRQHAIKNILQTFPSLSEKEARSIARRHYQTISVDEMESFWFQRDTDFFKAHTDVDGLDQLRKAAGCPGGALVLIGHFGSLGIFFVAIGKRGMPFYVVGRPIERAEDLLHPAHLKFGRKRLNDIGKAIGHPLLFTGRGDLPKMLELLRSGEILMTAFDVTPNILRHVRAVRFFGRTAYFPDGLARLQQQTGARVFHGSILRSQQRPYQRIRIQEVTGCPSTGENDLLQQLVSMLEDEIRKQPYQWTLWDSMGWFYQAPPEAQKHSKEDI